MRLPSLNLLRGKPRVAPAPAAPVESPPPPPPPPKAELWSAAHASLLDHLFGEGYTTPGGAGELLELAHLIKFEEGQNLLLLGAGGGGPCLSLAAEFGGWIDGFEAVPAFASAGGVRCKRARLRGKSSTREWSPAAPNFRKRFFHHAVILQALGGVGPEPLLTAAACAIRPGGHLVMLDLTSDTPPDDSDRLMQSWLELERRPAAPPSQAAVTEILGHLGFAVETVEDITLRQLHQVGTAWQRLLDSSKAQTAPFSAALLMAEAERWGGRMKLMRSGRLRVVRWHAILSATIDE